MEICARDDVKMVFSLKSPKRYRLETFSLLQFIFEVICNKNEKGKFKWSGELGGCKSADAATTAKPDVTTVADNGDSGTKSCKAIELKPGQIKSGVTVTNKVNSSKFPQCCQIQIDQYQIKLDVPKF